MKDVLKDYYQIFLSCPTGGLMQAARRRMEENVRRWTERSYEEMPSLDEVKDFIESTPDAPVLSEFVDKILAPLVQSEQERGETAAREYLDYLIDEDRID